MKGVENEQDQEKKKIPLKAHDWNVEQIYVISRFSKLPNK